MTGGAGFIGSHFVRHALARHPQQRITVLDRLTYAGRLANLRDVLDRIDFRRGDVRQPETVRAALSGCDAVVHFAAESHVDRSLLDARPFVRTNVEGTLVLLAAAAAAGVRRFLHVSTDEVYGELAAGDRSSLEDDPLRPRSPYAASKAAAEHLAFSWWASRGLDVVVTRGANTYGPFQYPEKIIPLFVTNALAGEPLPLYGDGGAVRDYLHVEDHCAGIDLILHHGLPGRAYNLGARLAVPGVAVAEDVLDLLGRPRDLIRFVADRPGHDRRYSVDPAAAEALGWKRRWGFADGLAQTVAWYATHAAWWTAIRRSTAFRRHHGAWYGARGGGTQPTVAAPRGPGG